MTGKREKKVREMEREDGVTLMRGGFRAESVGRELRSESVGIDPRSQDSFCILPAESRSRVAGVQTFS